MSAVFEPTARPRRESSAAWRVIEGEAVMVLPSTGKVHTLNEVGTRFWELIDGVRSLGDIAALLAAEFEAPADQIARDCDIFATELGERRLLVIDR